ncbi:DUF3520 domain-containing protein, partial [Salmonella enterica subsp. enterica serovar Kentucky]|nr:DUF3520 domain-containing protein [Salmonella enterica subsp. enterica serovar Kentucky]
IEFNPQWVTEYRQIGYEKRQLRDEDFNNDKVDAGDIGAGKHVSNGDESKESFCIMIPPPNVTGSLHMGHAFQQTIMDTMIRYQR